MNLSPNIQVKLIWDKKNEIRRFTLNPPYSFEQLKHRVNELLFPGTEGKFSLKYEDEDKDWITFSTDEELLQAISSSANLLRLSLDENESAWQTPSPAPQFEHQLPPQHLPPQNFNYPRWTEQTPQFQQTPYYAQPPPSYRPPMDTWENRRQNKFQDRVDKRQIKQEHREMKRQWKGTQGTESKLIARFVRHVTIEDDTKLQPSASFVKVWRFRNDGRIPWPETFQLLFVSKRKGDQMSGPDFATFQAIVQAGSEFDATINLVAPSHPGCYVGYWRLADMTGKKFGQRVRVKILVAPNAGAWIPPSPVPVPSPAWTPPSAPLQEQMQY